MDKLEIIKMVTLALTLILCSVGDIKNRRISLRVGIVAMIISITVNLLEIYDGVKINEVMYSAMPGICLLVISLLSGQAIGGGDGIILIIAGLLSDFGHALMGFSIGLLFACMIAIFMMAIRGESGKKEIPFIPFLTLGMACTYI